MISLFEIKKKNTDLEVDLKDTLVSLGKIKLHRQQMLDWLEFVLEKEKLAKEKEIIEWEIIIQEYEEMVKYLKKRLIQKRWYLEMDKIMAYQNFKEIIF